MLLEKTQIGCGTRKGAEIAVRLFRNIPVKSSTKKHILLILNFKNAFNAEPDSISNTAERLNAHCGFYTLQNCFTIPKFLYCLRRSTFFLLKKTYRKTYFEIGSKQSNKCVFH